MTAHASPAHVHLANAALSARHAGDGLVPPSLLDPSYPEQIVMYAANGEIYGQCEPASALYQVAFGSVRLYRLLADGRRQISAFCVANEVFGFESDSHHHFFAEAISTSAIRIFRKPLNGHSATAVLPVALKALVRAQEHLLVIGRQSAGERVAAFLVDMQERQGGLSTIELAMPRSDIADYLGLTIETVSRMFSRFKERGIIRLANARTVEIAKPDTLRAFCE